MKKLLVLAVAAVAAMSIGTAGASHDAQTVSATIDLPTAKVSGVGLLTRQQRCAYLLNGSQGTLGYTVDLNDGLGDGSHSFTLSGDAGIDFDVVFYFDLGTCDNSPAPVTLTEYSTDGAGGESGAIPLDANYAIVVHRGPTAAAFTFATD